MPSVVSHRPLATQTAEPGYTTEPEKLRLKVDVGVQCGGDDVPEAGAARKSIWRRHRRSVESCRNSCKSSDRRQTSHQGILAGLDPERRTSQAAPFWALQTGAAAASEERTNGPFGEESTETKRTTSRLRKACPHMTPHLPRYHGPPPRPPLSVPNSILGRPPGGSAARCAGRAASSYAMIRLPSLWWDARSRTSPCREGRRTRPLRRRRGRKSRRLFAR